MEVRLLKLQTKILSQFHICPWFDFKLDLRVTNANLKVQSHYNVCITYI